MAFKRQVQKQNAQFNQVRNVRELKRYTFAQFWQRAQGSFLITGGTERSRSWGLCEKLCCEMNRGILPSIVLTTSPILEQAMIQQVSSGAVAGALTVTNHYYRNYHFFYRWDTDDISRFMVQATALLGYADQEVPIYINAFINILSRCCQPGLPDMLKLAGYTDEQVAKIGAKCGASPRYIDQILHYAHAGEIFRLVLKQAGKVLAPLATAERDAQYNLSSMKLAPNQVYLVNVTSRFPELMYAYFAIELQLAATRNQALRIVFSDLSFREDHPLGLFLHDAQLIYRAEVGVATQNAAAMLGDGHGNFQSRVILLDAGYTDGDLEAVLKPLGSYTHYEAMVSGGKAAEFMPIFSNEQWASGMEQGRLRVRPVDTVGFRAVFYGANENEIFLVKEIS